jgi:hypothetical protein
MNNYTNNYTKLLVKLDFAYWKDKNPYFAQEDLHSSMAIGLGIIQKCGFLKDFNPKSSIEVSEAIEKAIKDYLDEPTNDSLLARVFDLIQAWGGKMGRHPYVVSKSRQRFSEWCGVYRRGSDYARGGQYAEALSSWDAIDGLGVSFATKHLRFWGGMPILDTRISLLLTGKKSPPTYDLFISMLKEIAQDRKLTLMEVEAGLFAFSQAFFPNEKLRLAEAANMGQKNSDIASGLAALYDIGNQ